jgi:hypothetical protein
VVVVIIFFSIQLYTDTCQSHTYFTLPARVGTIVAIWINFELPQIYHHLQLYMEKKTKNNIEFNRLYYYHYFYYLIVK